jgi:hypothetical protein
MSTVRLEAVGGFNLGPRSAFLHVVPPMTDGLIIVRRFHCFPLLRLPPGTAA